MNCDRAVNSLGEPVTTQGFSNGVLVGATSDPSLRAVTVEAVISRKALYKLSLFELYRVSVNIADQVFNSLLQYRARGNND